MRVLLLGGTGEARTLAFRLVDAGADVVSSMRGGVTNPTLPAGDVRFGGFGDVEGLASYLRDERIDRVVDATHPFAATITRHAFEACARRGVPLLVLRRPAWSAGPGDRWTHVPHIAAAAAAVRTSSADPVLLTTGRRDLVAFAEDDVHHFVIRSIDPPEGPTPPHVFLVSDRGPYDVEGETALLRRHGIALVVTKNSGGPLTDAKLTAARLHGVPVIVIDRPPLPDVDQVSDVDAALAWVSDRP